MDAITKEDLDRILGDVRSEAFQGKRVLVSGGSGFLGSWVCDFLVLAGARVVCLDNLSTGLFENVDHLKGTKGFEFERADVSSYVGRGKFDLVFHLVAGLRPRIIRSVLWRWFWRILRGNRGVRKSIFLLACKDM